MKRLLPEIIIWLLRVQMPYFSILEYSVESEGAQKDYSHYDENAEHALDKNSEAFNKSCYVDLHIIHLLKRD